MGKLSDEGADEHHGDRRQPVDVEEGALRVGVGCERWRVPAGEQIRDAVGGGGVRLGFEGGQMPVYRRLPKRGFNNAAFRLSFVEINLGTIQKAIDAKVLDASQEINGISLMEAGLIKNVQDGVRLLAKGSLTSKATIRVVGASKAAQTAVENAGGQLILEPKKVTVLEKGVKTSKKEPKKVYKKENKA